MGDLTRNFSREEFSCKDNCGFDKIQLTLVGALQVFRDMIGKRIIVTSGCRCPFHNKNEGGAPGSLHVKGEAIDFTCDDWFDLSRIANVLHDWGGGFHYYINDKFIHIDNGPYRRWEG